PGRPAGPGGGRSLLAAAWRIPGHPGRAAVALGAGLPRPAPREPGLSLRRRGHRRPRRLATLSPASRDRRALERRLHARAGLVPELPLHRGARARAGPPGGPRLAGRLPLGPGARRGVLGARCRGTRAAEGRRDAACRRAAAPPALPIATPSFRRR